MSTVYWRKPWNPIIGCTKCSEGCAHRYALAQAARMVRMGNKKYAEVLSGLEHPFDPVIWTGEVRIDEKALTAPRHVRQPQVYFTSMGDPFHTDVADGDLCSAWAVVEQLPRHTFLWCTKRPARMAAFFEQCTPSSPNLWLGASVCVTSEWGPACAALARLKARGWHTWLSYEPALEEPDMEALATLRPDWVVVGAETGRDARPMERNWWLRIEEWCQRYSTPLWTKALPRDG
ncbi:MAG: DUF5131 family protein, partial [Gammaproteobacteria bacterium]|nr:DUF5131 family protein [Gammaproteobacteria bacterium]